MTLTTRALGLGSLLTLSLVVWGAGTVRADAPSLIPLQGYLTDPDGVPIDGAVRVDVLVYDAQTDGTALFTEQHDVTVRAGSLALVIGGETSGGVDLSVARDNTELWLELVIDGDQIIAPRTRLGSVPFAAFAQYCDQARHAEAAGTAAALEAGDQDVALRLCLRLDSLSSGAASHDRSGGLRWLCQGIA